MNFEEWWHKGDLPSCIDKRLDHKAGERPDRLVDSLFAAQWTLLQQVAREAFEAGQTSRPKASEGRWIHWNGSSDTPPVPPDALVDVRFRNGRENLGRRAGDWRWKWDIGYGGSYDYDIADYRLSLEGVYD